MPLLKAFLPARKVWDWHDHADHDEFCIVLQGTGRFYWEDEVVDYKSEDVIIIPAGGKHKIEAAGSETNEFYFVRITV